MTLDPAFQVFLGDCRTRVDGALDHWLPGAGTQPGRLHQAMRYAVLGDGKRVRPVLCYAAAAVVGLPPEQADGPACAVELIHAYSLVHDDLPAMDDDELRRGRPTCHTAYDEATAILAGDGLQALAYRVLAHDPVLRATPECRLEMIDILATAAGSRGMVGGQALDIDATGRQIDVAQLENMHIHKTGALIRAAVRLGALSCADSDPDRVARLDRYAKNIGLAFQVHDDILDVEGDSAVIGKTQGKDAAQEKPTYPALLGLDGARELAANLFGEALAQLEVFSSEADPLRHLARYVVERRR